MKKQIYSDSTIHLSQIFQPYTDINPNLTRVENVQTSKLLSAVNYPCH